MDSLFSWKHCFRQTFYIFYLQNRRNEQNHARTRLPWEAFQTTSYTRILCNFHRNRCVHFIPTVNDTISSTETIHCQKKSLANTTKKDKPLQVCPRKPVKNTRAEKRPTGCLCWTVCIPRQISFFGNSCSLWDFLWGSPKIIHLRGNFWPSNSLKCPITRIRMCAFPHGRLSHWWNKDLHCCCCFNQPHEVFFTLLIAT